MTVCISRFHHSRHPVRGAARERALQTRDLRRAVPDLRRSAARCSASGMTVCISRFHHSRHPVRGAARERALQTRDLMKEVPDLRSSTACCSASAMTAMPDARRGASGMTAMKMTEKAPQSAAEMGALSGGEPRKSAPDGGPADGDRLDRRGVPAHTPAMIPRLFHDGPLAEGGLSVLSEAQAHYLRTVLRRAQGASCRFFNPRDGEFDAIVTALDKRRAEARIGRRVRPAEPPPAVDLLFAPVKRAATEMIIQKGTELGVGVFAPVVTERSNAERVRVDRLRAIAIEAAEQCGRLWIPDIRAPQRLDQTLRGWDDARPLFFCDEAGDAPGEPWGGRVGRAPPLLDVVRARGAARAAILIGPEGGFSPDERVRLRALSFVAPATLGPRILRADTAAIVALALWQATAGDLQCR
jgi:16S rRNA (uracil1498-N3)-methyltransferase